MRPKILHFYQVTRWCGCCWSGTTLCKPVCGGAVHLFDLRWITAILWLLTLPTFSGIFLSGFCFQDRTWKYFLNDVRQRPKAVENEECLLNIEAFSAQNDGSSLCFNLWWKKNWQGSLLGKEISLIPAEEKVSQQKSYLSYLSALFLLNKVH